MPKRKPKLAKSPGGKKSMDGKVSPLKMGIFRKC